MLTELPAFGKNKIKKWVDILLEDVSKIWGPASKPSIQIKSEKRKEHSI